MSPRNVRPAWISAGADGRAHGIGFGPRARDGFAWAWITLRTARGTVSDPEIRLDAGGHRDDGAGRLALTIPSTYAVEIERHPSGSVHIVAVPR